MQTMRCMLYIIVDEKVPNTCGCYRMKTIIIVSNEMEVCTSLRKIGEKPWACGECAIRMMFSRCQNIYNVILFYQYFWITPNTNVAIDIYDIHKLKLNTMPTVVYIYSDLFRWMIIKQFFNHINCLRPTKCRPHLDPMIHNPHSSILAFKYSTYIAYLCQQYSPTKPQSPWLTLHSLRHTWQFIAFLTFIDYHNLTMT